MDEDVSWSKEILAWGDQDDNRVEVTMLDVKVPWQRDLAERAESLRSALTENPSEAQHRLEAWEADTVKNLGLEDFR